MPAHKKVVSWRGGSAPQTITFFWKLCSFIYSPNTGSAVSRSNKVRTKLGRESNQTISWSGSLPRLQWANSCAQTITRTRYESNSIRARMQRQHLLYFTEDDTTDHNFWDNLQLCNLDCNKQIQNGWSPSRKARQSRAGVSSHYDWCAFIYHDLRRRVRRMGWLTEPRHIREPGGINERPRDALAGGVVALSWCARWPGYRIAYSVAGHKIYTLYIY